VLEGIELAGFIDHYWEAHEELGLVGLSEYVRAQFTESIAREIRELPLAVAELQAHYNATVEPPLEAPVERGEEVLTELHQGLAFLFEDGVDAREDKEFARMKAAFSDRSSHAALAGSLDGTADFAAKLRKRLKGIPRRRTRWAGMARCLRPTRRGRQASPARCRGGCWSMPRCRSRMRRRRDRQTVSGAPTSRHSSHVRH